MVFPCFCKVSRSIKYFPLILLRTVKRNVRVKASVLEFFHYTHLPLQKVSNLSGSRSKCDHTLGSGSKWIKVWLMSIYLCKVYRKMFWCLLPIQSHRKFLHKRKLHFTTCSMQCRIQNSWEGSTCLNCIYWCAWGLWIYDTTMRILMGCWKYLTGLMILHFFSLRTCLRFRIGFVFSFGWYRFPISVWFWPFKWIWVFIFTG